MWECRLAKNPGPTADGRTVRSETTTARGLGGGSGYLSSHLRQVRGGDQSGINGPQLAVESEGETGVDQDPGGHQAIHDKTKRIADDERRLAFAQAVDDPENGDGCVDAPGGQ